MKTKTFNEKLDAYLDKLYWAGRADGSDYERGNNTSNSKEECGITKQVIIDLICEDVIGKNETPKTYVKRYPYSIACGSKLSTKLSDKEKARNALRKDQRNIVRGK